MLLAICLLAFAQAPKDPIRIATEHYDLEWYGTRVEADDAARMLESSFDELETFFAARPKDRLRLRVFADEKARVEGAWNDGITIPTQSRYASFSEQTRTAYVARLDGPQATRSSLLYGACLQFHSLAKSKNLDIGRTWYAWGIALDFGRSTWDGEKLVAFAQPRIEPVDLPALALTAIGPDASNASVVDATKAVDPSLTWALTAMCLHGGKRSYRDAFKRYALGDTGTKLDTPDFLRTLGPPAKVAKDMRAFLLASQTPFEPHGDWEDRGNAGIVSHPVTTKNNYAVLRDATERLSARVSKLPKSGGRLGFVVGWAGPEDYVRIDIEAPEVYVHVMNQGRVVSASRLALPGDAQRERVIGIERSGVKYTLTVDATKHELELPSGRLGFFAGGAQVRFSELTWR